MRFLSQAACLIILTWPAVSFGQTLNELLLQEDPAKLVEDAKKFGKVVRGAILFHQGNINCAKCHRPTSEANRIGPDLSRMGNDSTEIHIVDSILSPSKIIKKGFETTTALKLNGVIVNGLLVSQDTDQVVIRDNQDPDRLIKIARKDIDEIQPGKKSSMPENLVNELKNRQQFLDLVRYVIDIKDRGPTADASVRQSTSISHDLDPHLEGLVLIEKLNCVACHGVKLPHTISTNKRAPNLAWSAKHLNPEYLERFVANPRETKLGTHMPHVLQSDAEMSADEKAKAVTQYLVSTAQNQFALESLEPAAIRRGLPLFHDVGCAACHAPRDEVNVESTTVKNSIPLGQLENKYSLSSLVNFLEDPLAARPSGHMPGMKLTHREAIDISSYLLQSQATTAKKWVDNPTLSEEGRKIFVESKCINCHGSFEDDQEIKFNIVGLTKSNPAKGCLSGSAGPWPDFDITDVELTSIKAALNNWPNALSSDEQIKVSLKSFNCIACHQRDDFGGIMPDRNSYFHTTNLNLGDQGRIPPTLTGVGAKLKQKWMRDVLVNGRSVRPYMNIRMPQYGEENIGHLIQLFQSLDQLEETKFPTFKDQKEMRKQGLMLAGSKGLNCVACHTYKYKLSDTMPAVDLTEMGERLKKDWFHQYMLAPQKFSPNTVMPSFWPNGVAIRNDLPGKPDMQIEALWQYLIDGRQAGTPSGVVREPLEIVVDDEAKMLRRSYQGIGKRGIGVGYPGGVNIAFDAEQLRLGFIWKGKFADPGGVWRGQGSGTVRPMERPINFIKGPELDDALNPWLVDEGRPPQHQFKGYVLDDKQRPTFLYKFDSISVADFFSSTTTGDDSMLTRAVSISSDAPRDNLIFRLASAKNIEDLGNTTYALDDRLTLRVSSDTKVNIAKRGESQVLEVPFQLDGQQKVVIEYQFIWK